MTEKNLLSICEDYLKDLPRTFWIKIHGSIFQRAGIPDLLGVTNGLFWAAELKIPSENPSPIQQSIIRKIRNAGGRAGVARSLDDLKAIIAGNPPPDLICVSAIEVLFWQEGHWRLPDLRLQYRIDPFVADFAIPKHRIVIECDGEAFHSSPKARERDARKDAFLKEQGWIVLRFTGAQIYDDTLKCVQEVLRHVR